MLETINGLLFLYKPRKNDEEITSLGLKLFVGFPYIL
jgi:hypothetical protein